MHVEYAQLPPPEDSADRIFITDNAVIVLDGATSFAPVEVSAQTYADHLGRCLANQLNSYPTLSLVSALAEAIRRTTTHLTLQPGESPASTVAILRENTSEYDMLVLGDTSVFWGDSHHQGQLVDDRLSWIGAPLRREYRDRLRAGYGFDAHHHELLRALQSEQRTQRNKEGGYWIAETEPAAAYNAVSASVPREQLNWAVLATDGAYNPLFHQGCPDLRDVAKYQSHEIAKLLARLRTSEAQIDPRAEQRPRAKLHDDMTVATIHPPPPTATIAP